ncbi:30S ribosomal protein S4 [Patescibacteria group bacterium]|nr:30S ribosomal protein S4 [Patescibacteria group bacterium]MBU1256185.1 30S ribosomal protein S4 [Patescibacteria group bacterium]MBU1457719.1 30S ribosomal protein S4 [Patescibacteria group bacterium]
MARYIKSKCRLCRREGTKLFLKGARCFGAKCPIERRGAQPPGQHGKKRHRRLSDYGIHLREKQKVKRTYGVLEKQFRNYYKQALKSSSNTGEKLLQLLESRLDNTVFRLGLVSSRSLARQLVNHGHVKVDNKKVSIPSFLVKPSQTISLSNKGAKLKFVQESLEQKTSPAKWLTKKALIGKVERLPLREELDDSIRENLIIEFYSR